MRILNAIEPETVIPIHRHADTSEDVIVLRGKAVEILYDEQGREQVRYLMQQGARHVGWDVESSWLVITDNED